MVIGVYSALPPTLYRFVALRAAFLFAQLVFDAVDQRVPTCFDYIFINADRAPGRSIGILTFDYDPHGGGRAGLAVDHADLVVDQLNCPEVREMPIKRFSQGGVQGVDGPIAL